MRRRLIVVLLSTAMCLLAVTSALAVKYNEAPMLRTRVAAGELPPLAERLPEEPCVYSAAWNRVPKENLDFKIGQYGGTLRTIRWSQDWACDVFCLNDESFLGSPGVEAEDIRGYVAKDFEISEDKKSIIFHMRKGLKWSDGVPVTIEDVLFNYEDVLLNKKITPSFPQYMRSGNRVDGEPMKLKVIDDYTFRVSFAEPYSGFTSWLAIMAWKGYTDLVKPKHYLKQFHAGYTPLEKLEPLIKKEQLSKGEWWTLFNLKDITNWELTSRRAVGFPVLYPWMMVKHTPTIVTYERNPYYFKVDKEGNQLPYIDRIEDKYISQMKMHTMEVIAGRLDYLRGDVTTIPNLSIYKENAKKGGYRVLLLNIVNEPVNLLINQTYSDPIWRKIVRDTRFRKALSLAINREEIIDAVYLGFAEPADLVPSEYNPKLANKLLDEVGLAKRDGEGWRLRPDGKRFVIRFEVATPAPPDVVPVLEFVKEYWGKMGIKTTVKKIGEGLHGERVATNQLKATAAWNHSPLWWGWGAWGESDIHQNNWPLWLNWYATQGKKGEEPPPDVKRFFNLCAKSVRFCPPESEKIADQFSQLMHEKVFWIQMFKKMKIPVIVSNKLGNVQHKGFAMTTGLAGEQLFFKQ